MDGELRPQQGSATPEQQIELEVTIDRTLRTVAGAFGIDYEPQADSSAPDGKWVFTSLPDLDQLIRQWQDIRDAILDRRTRIQQAYELARSPANDVLSQIQVAAFKTSLQEMRRQANAMYTYADAYAQRLEQARTEYATSEHHIRSKFTAPHG